MEIRETTFQEVSLRLSGGGEAASPRVLRWAIIRRERSVGCSDQTQPGYLDSNAEANPEKHETKKEKFMRLQSLLSRALLIVCLAIGASLSVETFAQSGPHEQNRISLLAPDNTMTVLPLESGTVKSKAKLGGIAGGKTATEIPGRQASVRVKSGQPQTFVVSLAAWGQGVTYEAMIAASPAMQFATLYKLDVNKKADTREVLFSETTGYAVFTKSKGMGDFRGIPLNFSRYDAQSVKIEPRAPLAPGEYAFVAIATATDPYAAQNQSHYYCFGID